MSLSKFGWVRLAVILLILYVLSQAGPVYLPLVLGTIAAFILHPVVKLVTKVRMWPAKRPIPPELAILLSFLVAAALLSIVSAYIFMPFVAEFNQFLLNVPKLAARVKQLTISLEVSERFAALPDNIRVIIDNGISNAAAYSLNIARRIVNAVFNFAGQVVELVVVPVLAFYFLRDWRSIRDNFISAFPPVARAKTRVIIDEIGIVISGYIRGQVLVSIVMGFFVFIGMYVLGVDYPLVLGLIAALTEAIPVIGPIIGAVPALFIAYLHSPALAVKVLVFYILIHQLENNVLVPNIMKHTLELHPVSIIISLLFGAHIAGVIGMIFAVPVTAILKVLYKHLWQYQES